MRPGGILLGRPFGIPVLLHSSWFLFAALAVMTLGGGPLAAAYPALGGGVYPLALLFVVLLYAGILAHEFGHALVARDVYGMRIASITLFLFGGVAALEDEPPRPAAEFWITLAGPAVSLVVGAAFLALGWWRAPGLFEAMVAGRPLEGFRPTDYVLWLVGFSNLGLAVFNMLPAFPLDGGRILRSALWAATGSLLRATRWAALVSRVLAFALLGYALGSFFDGEGFGALWLLVLAFFLMAATRQSLLAVELREALRDMTARQIMAPATLALPQNLSLEAAAEHFLRADQQVLPVVDHVGDFAGLVAVSELARVPRRAWATTTLGGLLHQQPERLRRALAALHVPPNAPGAAIYARLALHPLGRLPVLDGQRLVGTISRQRLEEALRGRGAR